MTREKSTRSSTSVIRQNTPGETRSRVAAAKGGYSTPAKMPKPSNAPPWRADHSKGARSARKAQSVRGVAVGVVRGVFYIR